MLWPALKNIHDAVFVLSAPGFEDRQASVAQQLGTQNFEFVTGVNKSETSKKKLAAGGIYDETRAIELDRSSKPMSVGHICCSLGHRMIYERVVELGLERVLIFEDDAVINAVEDSTIERIVADIPDDAELIYWGWVGGGYRPLFGGMKQALYHLQHSLGVLKYDHTMIRNLYGRPYNEHFDGAGKRFLTHAYSVTRSACEKLIEQNTPIALNADNALMYAILGGKVRAYVSKLKLFGQRSLDLSDPLQTATAD